MKSDIERKVDEYMEQRKRYGFFDLNCWWNYTESRMFRTHSTFDRLIMELGTYDIRKAVVTSYECLRSDPVKGNESLAENIKDHDDIYGSMVLVPDISIRGSDAGRYIDRKLEQGFVCARMFPKTLKHSMKDWLIKDILDHLERRKVPLILWHNEVSWDFIEALANSRKKLPVIIEGNDVKLLYHTRNYIPLLMQNENIYIETHNLVLYSEIEYLAGRVCADKLIFGTYYPYNSPDATILTITSGRMDEEIKYRIAHINLERLISEIRK